MEFRSLKFAAACLAIASLAACEGTTTPVVDTDDDNGNDLTPVLKITSDPTDLGGRGEWGGVVLSGYGLVNNGDDNKQTTSEAVPDGVTRWFGGSNNADSSGTMRYIVLADTGEAFRPDEEVQGLTVEAAGSGTQISYLQVTNSDDDGIEWFGGALGADHIVVQGASDDSLDMDLGYQGAIQYALVIQGASHGDKGIESDSNGDNFDAAPKSSPVIANLTILGDFGNGGAADANTSVLHREGFGGQVYRSVYTDNLLTGGTFDKGCLDLDDEVDEDLFYGDVVFNCATGFMQHDDDAFAADFTGGASADIEEDVDLTIDAATLSITATWAKSNYATELAAAGLDDTTYVGAVDPAASTAWWDGWTIRSAGIDGNLPGSASFHPLEAEIKDGIIVPASENGCADINADFEVGEPVEIFGVTFPVCVISQAILENTVLSNDHVYVLDGTVNVGDGDVEAASDKASTTSVALEIKPGAQVFGVSGSAASLVITRGSTINAVGTAELPIVFGGVEAE